MRKLILGRSAVSCLAFFFFSVCMRVTTGSVQSGFSRDDERIRARWFRAAEQNKLEEIKAFIRRGVNVNVRSSVGDTALIRAARHNSIDVMLCLMASGGLVKNMQDQQNGSTALIELLKYRKTFPKMSQFRLLLSPFSSDRELCRAEIRNLLMAQALAGLVNVNLGNNQGITALVGAAELGLAEVVKELLEHGADVEARYPHGPSPLIEASKNGHTDVVRLLIDAGAHVERFSDQALPVAVLQALANEHEQIALKLVRRGAPVPNIQALSQAVSPRFLASYRSFFLDRERYLRYLKERLEQSHVEYVASEAQCIECMKACLLEQDIPNDLWPLIGEFGGWEVAPASRVWRVPSIFARRLTVYPFCLGVGGMIGALLASGRGVIFLSYLRCVNWPHVAIGVFWVYGISMYLYVGHAAMNGNLDLSNWDSDDTWVGDYDMDWD